MFHFSLLASYAFDSAEEIILWLTVAVVAALLIAGISVYFVKRDCFSKFAKYGLLSFFAYALIGGITMLSLQLAKRTNTEYLDDKWLNHDVVNYVIVPLIVLFAFMLLGGIALFIISQKKKGLLKPFAISYGAICLAGVIAAAVTIGIYYSEHLTHDGYYNDYGTVEQVALYVSAGVLVIATVVAALILGRKDKNSFDSRSIAMAGICIAMSFVLSYVKLWSMPQGGSITLVSMLPVMLYAYIYGTKKGVLIGFIYGIMQAMQDPYIIHPAQFLLDYPLAFAVLGFAGVFRNITALKFHQVNFALGAVLAGSLRYLCHLLSGVFAFSAYALDQEFTDFWLYSAGYNSFVFVDVALVVVAGVIILSSKSLVKQIDAYSLSNKLKPVGKAEESTAETK